MKKKARKKMGRPPIPKEKRKSIIRSVRMTEAELALLESEAKKARGTIADILMRPWRGGK
jgi:hypothetical protein